MGSYEVLSSKKVYEGKIVDVVQDIIRLPDNKETVREVVVRGGAAGIVPVDSDGNIILVRQYRHPFRELLLEIPAGTLEKDEDPAICAERELEEEIGFKAEKISLLAKTYPTVGFCTEVLYLYLAEGLFPGKQNLDEDEFLQIEKYSLEQAIEMIYNGEIRDAKTISALLIAERKINK